MSRRIWDLDLLTFVYILDLGFGRGEKFKSLIILLIVDFPT